MYMLQYMYIYTYGRAITVEFLRSCRAAEGSAYCLVTGALL